MTTTQEARPASLETIFHPRSVAVVGVSKNQPGFAGVGLGFVLAIMEMKNAAVYPVNPKYDEVEGLKCYASVRDIEGPVDHVISSVPVKVVPQIIEDCIAKGVRSIHFFTAGLRETGEQEMEEMERQIVDRAREAGVRVFGPNCMGLYVPDAKLSFMPGLPTEGGNVGFLSQSGGNAGDVIFSSTVRGIRYSKAISYGNASDVDESELLEYLADDPDTEIIAAYIEGVKDGRRFFHALRKAASAKPVVVLKGGRTSAGTRAVMSHTANLAGSYEVFSALCKQVGVVLVKSVEEMVDVLVAFRFMGAPAGPGVAVVGGGGGFSVFAADEIDDAGLSCPELPEKTQADLREFTPVAGTSVRNPVDTILIFEPGALERTLRTIGEAENIDTVLFHTSFSWGNARRSFAMLDDMDPQQYMEALVRQMESARAASGTPIVLVLRPPLEAEGMGRTSAFQELCWKAGFPTYGSIPRAANSMATALRWRESRAL